jgi:hypothetical protein
MGLLVTLAGQDITSYVDEMTIDIESNLGQGPGVPQGSSGRATTCEFTVQLGPQASALGSGQYVPPITINLYPDNEADGADISAWTHGLGSGGSLAVDSSTAWHGTTSVKVVADGTGTYQSACANIPIANFSPNETITLSCYMKALSGSPVLRFYCQANDLANGNIRVGNVTNVTLTESWQRYTVTVTLPSSLSYNGYAWTEIGLRADTGGTAQAVTWWMDGLQIEEYGSATPWHEGTTVPQLVRQGEVIVYDAQGNRIFGGYASNLKDNTEYTVVKTDLTASDYWQNLARIGVNQVYASEYDTAIIQQLMAAYAPDVDMSLFNATPNYLFTKIYLKAKTLQEALQKIADTTGFDIWIDAYKRLRYESPSASATAPFAVSDAPDFITSFPMSIDKGNYEKDDTAIINRVFFYGGKTPSDDFIQDISPQVNGNNDTLVLAYYPREASDGKIHVTENGVALVLGYALSPGPANKLKKDGGTADVLLNADAHTLQFNTAPTAANTPVLCTYRYETPMVVQVTNSQSYAYFGRWFDGFISDSSVIDKQTAIQRGRILLLEQAYGLEHIELNCWRPGLLAGQLLRIDHNVRGIHNNYIIQSVKVKPLGAGNFAYDVTCGGWNWNLVDVLVQAGRQGMFNDNLTNESEDVVQDEAVFFGLSFHVVITTQTRTSGGYYARTAPVGDGHDAYAGLFTITS